MRRLDLPPSADGERADAPGDMATADGPAFSVLVAAYNHAEFIGEALDSIAAQTVDDYEIVVVDDGSTDRTPEILETWRAGFARHHANRVVIARVANGGQSRAYEHGIALCTGRFVCLLDSDDRWLPTKLEVVREAVRREPHAVMICHPVRVMGPTGRPTSQLRPHRAALSRGALRDQIRRTGRIVAAVTSGVTVRADVLRAIVPMPTREYRFGADGYITTAAGLAGHVVALPETLAMYRLHPGGQYVRRMLSDDGPRIAMEIHSSIARHLGFEDALNRSSYYARHAFAEVKFHDGARAQLAAYVRLIRATALDPTFSIATRIALAAVWTIGLLAPRQLFRRLWQAFQRRHTGIDRALSGAA